MLANNFLQQNSAQQNFQEQFVYTDNNFPTQHFQNMNGYEVGDFPKENFPVQWSAAGTVDDNKYVFGYDPDEIVKKTNLRIEAEEFVPRYISTVHVSNTPLLENPNIGFEVKHIDGGSLYSNLEFPPSVPVQSSVEFSGVSWTEQQIEENFPTRSEEISFDVNNRNFRVEAPEFVPRLNKTESTGNPTPIVVNTNIIIEPYIPGNVEQNDPASGIEFSLNASVQNPKEFNNTNEQIEKKYQNNSDEGLPVRHNGNVQHKPKEYPETSNWDYHTNKERESPKGEGNYQDKNKFRQSQSFRESPSRNRFDEGGNYRRQSTSTNRQENESTYQSQKNETRPNRKYSDRVENQNKYHENDHRKNNQRSSPSFRKNKSPDVPDKKGNTTEFSSTDENTRPDTKEVKPIYKNDKQLRNSRLESHTSKNSKGEPPVSDEDNFKRKWSDRQSLGSDRSFDNHKELEDARTKHEEPGTKSRNQRDFRNSRNASANLQGVWDQKDKTRISQRAQQMSDTSKKPLPKSPEIHKDQEKEETQKEGDVSKSPDTGHYFDEKQFQKDKERKSLDSARSLRAPKYKTKDQNWELNTSDNSAKTQDGFKVDDSVRSQRRSLGSFRDQKGPERSFRDALFAEKRPNEKLRDPKQERNGAKVEKTVQYQWNEDEFKNRKSERSSGDLNIENLFDKKYAETDPEYKEFLRELQAGKTMESEKIKEQHQDLFEMPKDYALAHCVAEDLRMGRGIAVSFRNTFKSVDSLLNQRQKPGGVAILKEDIAGCPRYLYYLITKRRSRDKPTYKDFWCSMKILRDHIRFHKVKKLAVPKLGCGLDRLDWSTVKHLMAFLFRDVAVEIVVCNFYQTEDNLDNSFHSVKVQHKNETITNAKKSVVLYFCSADAYVSDDMAELDGRYKFLDDFKKAPKNFGVVVKYQTDDCTLCGCIVRKTMNAPFDFRSFSKCLGEISKLVNDRGNCSIALPCLMEETDDLLHQKIITIIVNYLQNVDVYVYTRESDISFDET